jgi:hypothetical protein
MFEILPGPSLETLLMAGRAVLLVGALWIFAVAFLRWRRADERANAALHVQLERVFGELRSLHETVIVMSARLDALGERSEMELRLAPAGAAGAQRGYDVAARLARNGAGVDELITNCGITRHEAELLVRLHSAKTREAVVVPTRTQRPMQDARPQQHQAPQPAANRKRGSLLSVVG